MSEQQKQDNEKFYDEEIAPVILELMKKCRDKGMGLHAVVYNQEDVYESCASGDKGTSERLNYYAIKSLGNVDKFMMALLKDVEENGHGSVYLKILQDHMAGKYKYK